MTLTRTHPRRAENHRRLHTPFPAPTTQPAAPIRPETALRHFERMSLPGPAFPYDFLQDIWQRAAARVATWFGPICEAGGSVSRGAKRDIALNLPLLEHCVRQILRVLALHVGPIMPAPKPHNPKARTAAQGVSLVDHDTLPNPARKMRLPLFRLSDPSPAPLQANPALASRPGPSLPSASRPPRRAELTLGLPLTTRLAALIDVFSGPDKHIARMRAHLADKQADTPPRSIGTTQSHARWLAEDVRILDRFVTRNVIPANTS